MSTFTVIGACCALFGAFGFMACMVLLLLAHLDKRRARRELADEAAALRRLGPKLRRDCYWFSEDRSVMTLVDVLGQRLSEDAYFDVDKVRTRWRVLRKDAT